MYPQSIPNNMFYIPKKKHDIAMKMPGLDAADALVSATREKKHGTFQEEHVKIHGISPIKFWI